MSDKGTRQNDNVPVPTGSLGFHSDKPTVLTAVQYLVEHPYWMILAVTMIVLPPMIGYKLSGFWSIIFGWVSGGVGFYVGAKALTKVIEHRGG